MHIENQNCSPTMKINLSSEQLVLFQRSVEQHLICCGIVDQIKRLNLYSQNNCFTMSLQTCLICEKTGENLTCVVRGRNKLIDASEERNDGKRDVFQNTVEIHVHADCRKDYTKPQSIEAFKRKQRNAKSSSDGAARSVLIGFDIRENCFICGEKIEECSRSKKSKYCSKVQGENFQKNLVEMCQSRNDDHGINIQLRIGAHNLKAVGARYHLHCYAAYKSHSERPATRPVKSKVASEKLCNFIDESDKCQHSMNE